MIMGCSTSSPAVTDANKERTLSANKINDKKITDNSNMDDQQNQGGGNTGENDTNKYPASEAFIIPLSDDAETKVYTAGAPEVNDLLAATVKKQPPKRIQELIEQAAESETTAVNLQDLEDKLEKAEERRKELLQQKIINIQKTTQMLTRSGSNELMEKGEEEEGETSGDKHMGKRDNTTESNAAKN